MERKDRMLSEEDLELVTGGAGQGVIKKYFDEKYKRCPKCKQKKMVNGRCLNCNAGMPNPTERA